MPEQSDKLNPQVKSIEVGVRSLRKITIYPLSIADQSRLIDKVWGTIDEFFQNKEGEKSNSEFAKYMVEVIRVNLLEILSLITDKEEFEGDPLEDMTNLQVSELALLIYEENFEGATKNFQSLFGKIRKLFPSERPLPTSVDLMEAIDSKMSTEKASEMED